MSSKKHNLTSNLLIHYSAKRARKDARDRQRLIDKAKRYEENPALLKSDLRRDGKSYLKVEADQLSAEVDQERIDANAFFVSSLNTFFYKFSRSKKMGTIRKEVPIFYLTASGRGSSL